MSDRERRWWITFVVAFCLGIIANTCHQIIQITLRGY